MSTTAVLTVVDLDGFPSESQLEAVFTCTDSARLDTVSLKSLENDSSVACVAGDAGELCQVSTHI